MTQEISLIVNSISKVIEEIGLPKIDAEKIIESFSEVAERIEEVKKELIDFNSTNTEITLGVCTQAKTLRLKLVKIRTRNDEIHKTIKENVLLRTKAIDGVRNFYKLLLVEREDQLKNVETHYEQLEAEKLNKLESERVEKLSKFVVDISFYNLRDMSNAGFEELLKNSEIAFNKRIEEEEKIEKERLAEEKRKEEENEKIRLENIKLKKEAEKREVEIKLENEKKEKKLKKLKEIQVKTERLAKEKLEAEIIEKSRLETKRLAEIELAEEKLKEEAEKERIKAESAPDKKKIEEYVRKINEIEIPVVRMEDSQTQLDYITDLIKKINNSIK